MPCEPGEVVLIRFPFTNQQAAKQRPAVVVSSTAYNTRRPDAVLLAVTSRMRPSLGFAEAPIVGWQTAGLLRPSVLKPLLFTVEQTLIRKTLGRLDTHDRSSLLRVLREMLLQPGG